MLLDGLVSEDHLVLKVELVYRGLLAALDLPEQLVTRVRRALPESQDLSGRLGRVECKVISVRTEGQDLLDKQDSPVPRDLRVLEVLWAPPGLVVQQEPAGRRELLELLVIPVYLVQLEPLVLPEHLVSPVVVVSPECEDVMVLRVLPALRDLLALPDQQDLLAVRVSLASWGLRERLVHPERLGILVFQVQLELLGLPVVLVQGGL